MTDPEKINHRSRYRLIYGDPPWMYRNFTRTAHGAAASAMVCMPTSEIIKIPVVKWAAPDAYLIMWGTWPKLPDALRVMYSWGFDYVTACPWVKTTPSTESIRTGVGFWFQGTSEILLVGKRGKPTTKGRVPVKGLLCGSEQQFYCPKQKAHSQKPLDIYAWIEEKLHGPYLELFARSKPPETKNGEKWTAWGLDLGQILTPDGAYDVGEGRYL